MIVDQIENIKMYSPLLNYLEEGLEAISSQMTKLETGRYEFEHGFYLVQKGDTKPMAEGFYEAHRKYVDVQIIIEGSEEVAWLNLKGLTEDVPYNAEKDVAFYTGNTSHAMYFSKGMFYIAFPHDGHRPVRHTEKQQSFTKIVLKLPVNV
jgi:YhcH/YjgK/YiaL family protein